MTAPRWWSGVGGEGGLVGAAMKVCTGCKEDKPIEQFYRRAAATDGRASQCKTCSDGIVRSWNARNPDRKRFHSRETARKAWNAGKRQDPKQVGVNTKAWKARNPERIALIQRASVLVFRAVKSGTLVRPTTCESCATSDVPIEAAHFDYSRPLEVRWLCRPCHRAWDIAEPKSLLPVRPGIPTA